jgi:hypothetical protein
VNREERRRRGARGPRSLVDELVEGEHDHRPPEVQAALRAIANNRFLFPEEKARRARRIIETAEGRR